MSKFLNSFRATKPVVDISSNIQFPELSNKHKSNDLAEWNCEKVTKFSDSAKYYKNGDVYDGEFDEEGLPCYGKLTFANGDVYEGPIRDLWIKDDEEDEDEDGGEFDSETEYDEDYYDEEYYEEPPTDNYGRMTFKSGRVFWGVFNFGDRRKWA